MSLCITQLEFAFDELLKIKGKDIKYLIGMLHQIDEVIKLTIPKKGLETPHENSNI